MEQSTKHGLFGSLKVKVGGFSVCILLVVAAVYTGFSLKTLVSVQKYTLENQKSLMLSAYDEKIQWQVQNVISLIKTYDELYKDQGLSLEERKSFIKEFLD